ncbi:MAG: hypothetical protein F4071_06620, partial [Acidimicrobiaceae bacterium]|nr:hypothetical protein [Acidimicrobiaceae bacterium]
MRIIRRVRVLSLAAVLLGAALVMGLPAAAASNTTGVAAQAGPGVVDVVEVSGYLDPIIADFIERSIDKAVADGSLGLVLQVNSSRATIDDQRLRELADRIAGAGVPVTMWVGPSGSEARGGVGQLAGVVTDLALAPGSVLG